MLDARSPLVDVTTVSGPGVTLSESAGFTLTQISGDDGVLRKASKGTALRIAPKQVWLIDAQPAATKGLFITPLSSSRTRFLLEGAKSRDVLARCAFIDFEMLKQGHFVTTGIHHTPVLIHCIGEHSFHIYAMRTFAVSVWEWVADAIKGLKHD
jgi:heterotetrameric sarcosine oxidase gamma subunit